MDFADRFACMFVRGDEDYFSVRMKKKYSEKLRSPVTRATKDADSDLVVHSYLEKPLRLGVLSVSAFSLRPVKHRDAKSAETPRRPQTVTLTFSATLLRISSNKIDPSLRAFAAGTSNSARM